jgi:hypothetical protein
MNLDDALADWDGSNGHNGHNGVGELEEIFEGYNYEFRHFEDCRVSYMRWQAGRSELIEVQVGKHWLMLEVFHLLEWASSQTELVEKLTLR